MTTKTDEQERADFEAFAASSNYDLDAVLLLSKPPKFSHYLNPNTQAALKAWQARAALQSQDREDAEDLDSAEVRIKLLDEHGNIVYEAIDHARRIEGEGK